jgi:hypothetical protein
MPDTIYDPNTATIRDDIIEIERRTSSYIENETHRSPNTCGMVENEDIENFSPLYSCGLHFHVSSDSILYNGKIGLLFLVNLLLAWGGSDILTANSGNGKKGKSLQDVFLSEFLYQKSIHGSTYAPLNIDNTHELLKIKKKILELDHQATRDTNPNIDQLMINLQTISRAKDRPLLTIVLKDEDEKYIHVEFRGLLPWDLQDQIPRFVNKLISVYTDIYYYSLSELNSKILEA